MMVEKEHAPIKDWPDDDKPREKLLNKGKTTLSNAELIAILICTGSKSESAVDLSNRILASADYNLNALSNLSVNQLKEFKGIGISKAVCIVAALELGRRHRHEEAAAIESITSSKTVFDIMQPLIGQLRHEEFWILYLNNSNKVLCKIQLSKGGITGTIVDARLVFRNAVECGATAIILCHNHPSGALVPSNADKQITRKLKSAGENLDVKVIDHIIVTQHAYFSFADEGIL